MKVAQRHNAKTIVRYHFIAEWAAKRGKRQKDIVEATGVDKGTVSRWFAGDMPSSTNLIQVADMFAISVPSLFRHPDDDWLAEFFNSRNADEKRRAIRILEASFDDGKQAGTDN